MKKPEGIIKTVGPAVAKKDGGAVTAKEAGGNPSVFASARNRKAGGRIGGGTARMNLGRPGRKTGGAVGSNASPLSTAAKVG